MSLFALLEAEHIPDVIVPSEAETRRFGVSIGRLAIGPVGRAELDAVIDLVDRSPLDVIILRFPASFTDWYQPLACTQRIAFHADTLVYWEAKLEGTTRSLSGRTRVLEVDAHDALGRLSESVFTDYASHYRANPLCSATAVARGYGEWAASTLERRDATVLVIGDEELLAFAATVHADQEPAEVELAGVAPDARRRGLYNELLEGVENYVSELGASSLVISTQAQNLAPQRCWLRRDYVPIHVFETMHLVTRRALSGVRN